jgi:hypothetical protein
MMRPHVEAPAATPNDRLKRLNIVVTPSPGINIGRIYNDRRPGLVNSICSSKSKLNDNYNGRG